MAIYIYVCVFYNKQELITPNEFNNAYVTYPAIYRIATEMSTSQFQCGVLWNMEKVHCGICEIPHTHSPGNRRLPVCVAPVLVVVGLVGSEDIR